MQVAGQVRGLTSACGRASWASSWWPDAAGAIAEAAHLLTTDCGASEATTHPRNRAEASRGSGSTSYAQRQKNGQRTVRPSRPLRTVHASFNAYGSSIGQRIGADTRWSHWALGSPVRYHGRAGYRSDPTVATAAPARTVTIPPTDLRCCLRRLTDGSRTPIPEGSLPAFAVG
jgi:hypothetical protein